MKFHNTVGFGILGAGVAADLHHQAITANADNGAHLYAVSHYNPDRFDRISAEFGVPCLSPKELLRHPEVDVISICTPSGLHAAQTIAAAESGKHVLVEKPMALSIADADAMIEACARAGVSLGVMLQRRAEPVFRDIRRAIQSGDLGELTMSTVSIPYHRPQSYYNQADWRGTWVLDGGGVLMNQGIHLLDLLIWYMGDPVQVQACADTLGRAIEVEDTLSTLLRFANGALATLAATTTASPGFPHRLEIYGTTGGIQVAGEAVIRWDVTDRAKLIVSPPEVEEAADAGAGGDPRGIAITGHVAVVRDFIQALRVGRQPEIDGVEGRRSVAVVSAIYQAAGLVPNVN